MRKFPYSISIAASLLVAWMLTACVPLSTQPSGAGPSSASLGPDSVRVEQSKSSLPARIKSGLSWLWASYTRLHDAGTVPGLDDLKADIGDLEAVFARGDLMAALDLYSRARARVTAIAAEVGK